MQQTFEHLEWDSDFFGFSVARIIQTDLSATELSETLRILREKNYRLAYWQFSTVHEDSTQIALAQGGFFADEKLTYVKELPEEQISLPHSAHTPYAYPDSTPDPSIVKLALQSSEYSRFRVDPQFSDELCDRLYTRWISRSISKELAWEVLVVAESGEYLGLITLGASNGRGDIGLLAVTEQARGRGIGKALVAAAENRFMENHDSVVQVVTQKHNPGACRLYEACGFRIDTSDSVFHFWL